jgi:hypothetical protein
MVGETNPDQIQFLPDAFGVAVDEFRRQGFRRIKKAGQFPAQSRYPISAHDPMITTNWLAFQ